MLKKIHLYCETHQSVYWTACGIIGLILGATCGRDMPFIG